MSDASAGVFLDSLGPALDAFGLDGVFRIKEKQHEGLATFFRRSAPLSCSFSARFRF